MVGLCFTERLRVFLGIPLVGTLVHCSSLPPKEFHQEMLQKCDGIQYCILGWCDLPQVSSNPAISIQSSTLTIRLQFECTITLHAVHKYQTTQICQCNCRAYVPLFQVTFIYIQIHSDILTRIYNQGWRTGLVRFYWFLFLIPNQLMLQMRKIDY